MTNIELSEKIYEKLLEIRELYFKEYPKGNYLDMAFVNGSILINNHPSDDIDFPIDFYRHPKEKEEENND